MTDIFEGWRDKRYVITEYDDHTTIVLVDVLYWAKHYDQLIEWCDLNDCEPVGMTVDVHDTATLTAFALRWS